MQELRRLGHDHRAFGIALVAPGCETLFGCRDPGPKLLVGQALKLLQDFAGGGIHALVLDGLDDLHGHVLCPFGSSTSSRLVVVPTGVRTALLGWPSP